MNLEDLILDLADLVYEVRRLREENQQLKEWKTEKEKQTQEMIQTNLQNTADFLENL